MFKISHQQAKCLDSVPLDESREERIKKLYRTIVANINKAVSIGIDLGVKDFTKIIGYVENKDIFVGMLIGNVIRVDYDEEYKERRNKIRIGRTTEEFMLEMWGQNNCKAIMKGI